MPVATEDSSVTDTRPRKTTIRRPRAGIAIDPKKLSNRREMFRLGDDISLSRAQLSQMAGVSVDAIAKIENGHRRPKPKTLGQLCRALGCEPEDLMP